jgi:hypothetical protein
MSPIDPPATERKALPAKPSKKRATSIVAMFFATANNRRPLVDYTNLRRNTYLPQGISQIVKKRYAPTYTGRLP